MISHPELREPGPMRRTLIGVQIVITFLSSVVWVLESSGQVAEQLEPAHAHATPTTESARTQESAGSSQAPAATTTEKDSAKTKKKKLPGRGAILVAPLPIVSPAIGNGLIPVVGYIFPFSKNDKESPPST